MQEFSKEFLEELPDELTEKFLQEKNPKEFLEELLMELLEEFPKKPLFKISVWNFQWMLEPIAGRIAEGTRVRISDGTSGKLSHSTYSFPQELLKDCPNDFLKEYQKTIL